MDAKSGRIPEGRFKSCHFCESRIATENPFAMKIGDRIVVVCDECKSVIAEICRDTVNQK